MVNCLLLISSYSCVLLSLNGICIDELLRNSLNQISGLSRVTLISSL